jgi:hypothetical protein
MTVSVKTEKTLPFQASLEEMSLAFFALAADWVDGWRADWAVGVGAETGKRFFFVAAIETTVSSASQGEDRASYAL